MNRMFQVFAASTVVLICATGADAATLRMLLERDTDAGPGSDVFLASFDTFEDLLAGTTSQAGFSQVDINANYSVGGLAYKAPNNNGGPAVIPLPAGGLLLLSALASAFAFRRKDKLLR